MAVVWCGLYDRFPTYQTIPTHQTIQTQTPRIPTHQAVEVAQANKTLVKVKTLNKTKGPESQKTEEKPSTFEKLKVSCTSLIENMNKMNNWLTQNGIRMRKWRMKKYKHMQRHRKPYRL